MSSGNPEQERARAMMRKIYEESGHDFKPYELDKLVADAEEYVQKWSAFAAEEVALAVAEMKVFLVCSLDLGNRKTLLYCVCTTRDKAESYRQGVATRENQKGERVRVWIEEVLANHLLGSSMGIYHLPDFTSGRR